MRVRIIFGLQNKGAYVPFHHQYVLAEFLNPYIEEYKRVFGKEEVGELNYSALKGQTRVGKDGLHFYSSKVTLVFSSLNLEFVDFLMSRIFSQVQVMVGRLLLAPLHVDKEVVPEFLEEMKYLCLSPTCIMDPLDETQDTKRFINPVLDQFSDFLYESTISRMEKAGYTAEQLASFYKFQLVPDKDYLLKVKGEEKKFARIFPVFLNNTKYELRGYTFPFTLYADPEVQKFVFNAGLGYMTRKGFGMLDIAHSDPNARSIPFEVKRDFRLGS